MKWKTLCLTAALTAVLAAVPAYALDYTVDAPEDYLFGRPTSVETVTEYGADNVDRSKNTALIPPAFGSPTSYLPDTGEPLTPMEIMTAVFSVCGGVVQSIMGSIGGMSAASVTLPQEIADAMLILVALIKGAERIAKEMFGL